MTETKYFCFLPIFQEGYYITKLKSSRSNIDYAFILVAKIGGSVLCAADIHYIVEQIFYEYVERISQSILILKKGFKIASPNRSILRTDITAMGCDFE